MDDTIPEHVEGAGGDPDHELGDDAAIHTEMGSQIGDGDEREVCDHLWKFGKEYTRSHTLPPTHKL